MDVELHMAARLVAAAALGALVGMEREASDQPAGLRTHMSVALGAALFGVISTLGFDEFEGRRAATNVQIDVTRVASTVVTGIGFLGAGMIFRRGSVVHNLTTAASLWVVAAIGLSCGVGDMGPATVATVALLLGLVLLRLPRRWIRSTFSRRQELVRIVLALGSDDAPAELALRALPGITVKRVGLEKDQGAYVLSAIVQAAAGLDLVVALSDLSRRPDVMTLRIGAPE